MDAAPEQGGGSVAEGSTTPAPASSVTVTAATTPATNTVSTPSTPANSSSMPAPTSQAPPRSRRTPAVDASPLIPARRSSTRSIKRKKFDDELVESSLVKTERGRIKTTAAATQSTPLAAPATASGSATPSQAVSHPSILTPAMVATNTIQAAAVGAGGSTGSLLMVTASTATAAASASTTALTSAVAAGTPVSHLTAFKLVKAKEEMKPAVKHVDAATATSTSARPPSEKRMKPSGGKGQASAKGGGGKVTTSKASSGKSGSSKGAGSRSGLAKSSHSKSRSKNKRSRKQKTTSPAVKDLGRWKPQDDLALITAVQQTNDLSAVHTGVKFTCRFTLKEIEERWYALLYDPAISKIAMEAARQLHQETVATIQGKALYSNAEEKLLGTITSTSQPTVETFQTMLQQHPDVFHPARTAKTLHSHWLLMKQYHLLPDQTVQPMPRGDHVLNLSDIEDFMNDDELLEEKSDMVEQELALVDRRNKREIRHLEQEMPKWQVLVDSVTGISMPDFDSQTLGVLRGRLVRYLMRSREITLGRATKDNHVDVDLSLEGPAWEVSRRQGIIKLRNSGDFFIANEGKRPILVDGRPVLAGNKHKLNNNSVVEISCLRFTFLINQEVINAIRSDASKTGSSVSVGTT